jgi:TetR/AcrR family transcriptional regulator, mexJK operon transcriptional repressor
LGKVARQDLTGISRLGRTGSTIRLVATRRGRPTQAEAKKLDLAVREAAVATFLELGYAGASMEAIAKAAGVTRRSLYTRYADKRALFASVIPWALARFVDDEVVADVDGDDLEAALLAVGRAAVTRAVHPQNVRLKQIAMSEAAMFPEFKVSAESMMWAGRQRAVTELLRRHAELGNIDVGDPELAAEHFLAMVEAVPARTGTGGGQHDRVRDAGCQHHRGDSFGPDNSGADHLPSQRSGVAHPAVPHGDPRHRGRLPVRRGEAVTMGNTLPQAFSEIEPYVADWALATRAERYAARLDRPFDELVAFYDAIAPRAEEAIAYLDGRDINALSDEATRLLHLLYSMILVSYAVNVFKQNRIPDAGAAFFEMVAEPIP